MRRCLCVDQFLRRKPTFTAKFRLPLLKQIVVVHCHDATQNLPYHLLCVHILSCRNSHEHLPSATDMLIIPSSGRQILSHHRTSPSQATRCQYTVCHSSCKQHPRHSINLSIQLQQLSREIGAKHLATQQAPVLCMQLQNCSYFCLRYHCISKPLKLCSANAAACYPAAHAERCIWPFHRAQ